jgi:hypothetical protein
MSCGKYLSLEEARKSGKLDRFAKEHPSEGDRSRFNRQLLSLGIAQKSLFLRHGEPVCLGDKRPG